VAADVERNGDDDTPLFGPNLPAKGNEFGRENDHADHGEDRDDKGDAEAGQDLGYFEEKVGSLDFLLCRTPGNVVREQVRQHGFREVDGKTTKEDEAGGHQCGFIKKERRLTRTEST
jgi:hypothetical protein